MARSTSSPGIAAAASEPAPQVREVRRRSLLLNLLISLRPGQWTKNLLVFAGLLFGLQLLNSAAVARAMAAFVTFCALSGVVYLINDVLDRESDRQHPHKANRPIASGALPVAVAIGAAVALTVAALATAVFLGGRFAAVAIAYLTLLALYSGFLKHIVIIDVLTIAMAYVFYTINPETEQKFGTQWLGLTIPFPLYGIFRYLYLVHSREGGGSPADLLITDRPLLLCVALWGISVVLIIYKPF